MIETTTLDPDRYFDLPGAGSQEWWYFDAISADGRDALVVVWYAGLPFDPDYGTAALRHLRDPGRHPAPRPLDHCALGLSWYRDGKTLAYALNAFREPDFEHRAEPFSVRVAGNLLERDAEGYRLRVDTPAVDGSTRLRGDFRFRPAPATRPLERDLGSPGSPHVWALAAPDCRVEGRLVAAGPDAERVLDFEGRGYHDHNAGSEEISRAMRRWSWGRAHHGPLTLVYYRARPRRGREQALAVVCRDGTPESVVETPAWSEGLPGWNVFGIRYPRTLSWSAGGVDVRVRPRNLVDSGPFYLRWVSEFAVGGGPEGAGAVPGISELLATGGLNKPWFNWMIPYRLKRPGA